MDLDSNYIVTLENSFNYTKTLATPSTSGNNLDQTPIPMATKFCPKQLYATTSGLDSDSTTEDAMPLSKKVTKKETFYAKQHICDEYNCGKQFTRAYDVIQHKRKVHKITKPYKCSISGCNFRSEGFTQLKQHLTSCTGGGGDETSNNNNDNDNNSENEINEEKKIAEGEDENEMRIGTSSEIEPTIDYSKII